MTSTKPSILLGAIASVLSGEAYGDTIRCVDPAGSVEIALVVEFNAMRDDGTVVLVRADTPHLTLSTTAGENGSEHPETIGSQDLAFDTLGLTLDSYDSPRITLSLKLVRAATYRPDDLPEDDAVVAGVAWVASMGPVTLTCEGW